MSIENLVFQVAPDGEVGEVTTTSLPETTTVLGDPTPNPLEKFAASHGDDVASGPLLAGVVLGTTAILFAIKNIGGKGEQ